MLKATAIGALVVALGGTWAARTWVGSPAAPAGLHLAAPATDAVACLVAVIMLVRARSRDTDHRARTAWAFQVAGCALATIAPAGAFTGGLTGAFTGGSGLPLVMAAVGATGSLVLMSVGLIMTSRGPDPRARVRMVLDGVVVAVAALVLVWSVRVAPLVGDDDARQQTALGTSVAAGGALGLAMFYTVLVFTEFHPDRRRMPAFYIAGLLAIGLSHLRFVELSAAAGHPASVLDSGGWAVGFLLIACAGAAYRGTTVRQTEFVAARWIPYLPYLGIVLAGSAIGAQALVVGRVPLPEWVAGGVIVAVVLARQLLLLSQNRSLVAELADREADLRCQARHDALTGLGNRVLLLDELTAALTACRERDADGAGAARPLALMLCDLDDFKVVNDTLGHAAGDELLVQVAGRLRAGVRAGDVVVRLGGDEFAVLLRATPDDALAVARQLRAAFQEPFPVSGHRINLSSSIGVANLAGAREDGAELLKGADLAMYEAKRRGKNGVQVFSPQLRGDAAAVLELRSDLREALDRGDVTVAFQPLVRVGDGVVVALEALVRWTHPELGPVPAAQVIAAAGRGHTLQRLSEVTLAAACSAAAGWGGTPAGRPSVAVNLSPAQLAEPHLVPQVRAALEAAGLDGARLTLEVAEAALLRDPDAAGQALRQLQLLGCRVAVDDFGVGHCALAPLTDLPVDLVKLDVTLVGDLARRGDLARAVIGLARSRGIGVAAEGVETVEHWQAVHDLGCDLVQGHLVSAPLAPQDVAAVLHRRLLPDAYAELPGA